MPLTRAPLRNRTVDLLLTIPNQSDRQNATGAPNSPNANSQDLPLRQTRRGRSCEASPTSGSSPSRTTSGEVALIRYQRAPSEPDKPLRSLYFGPHSEGLVTFLVYPPDDLALVTRIQWLGPQQP
jgi:hypothetical protein